MPDIKKEAGKNEMHGIELGETKKNDDEGRASLVIKICCTLPTNEYITKLMNVFIDHYLPNSDSLELSTSAEYSPGL